MKVKLEGNFMTLNNFNFISIFLSENQFDNLANFALLVTEKSPPKKVGRS